MKRKDNKKKELGLKMRKQREREKGQGNPRQELKETWPLIRMTLKTL